MTMNSHDPFWLIAQTSFAPVKQQNSSPNTGGGFASVNLRSSIAYSPPMTIKQLVELECSGGLGARSVQRIWGGSTAGSESVRHAQVSGRHHSANGGVSNVSTRRPSSSFVALRSSGHGSSQISPPSPTVMTGTCSFPRSFSLDCDICH